ncbi:unnamed protein product [Durusdinium trenchii]|uniref:Uncharacterized protein n=1 Tax=Durusdinium trenchii TaxID=1381693 RepID=A0ABP0NFU6_9DINO
MKRNEELERGDAREAEIEQLKNQLKAKTQEVAETTKASSINSRRQSTDLMAQMEQMKKQLENAKKETCGPAPVQRQSSSSR